MRVDPVVARPDEVVLPVARRGDVVIAEDDVGLVVATSLDATEPRALLRDARTASIHDGLESLGGARDGGILDGVPVVGDLVATGEAASDAPSELERLLLPPRQAVQLADPTGDGVTTPGECNLLDDEASQVQAGRPARPTGPGRGAHEARGARGEPDQEVASLHDQTPGARPVPHARGPSTPTCGDRRT